LSSEGGKNNRRESGRGASPSARFHNKKKILAKEGQSLLREVLMAGGKGFQLDGIKRPLIPGVEVQGSGGKRSHSKETHNSNRTRDLEERSPFRRGERAICSRAQRGGKGLIGRENQSRKKRAS